MNKEYFSDYYQRRYQERIAAGMCTRCGKRKPREGLRTCVECAKRQRELDKSSYMRRGIEKRTRECTCTNYTLCIDCENAVPTLDGKHGCEWSRHFKPVPGWDAKRNDIKLQAKKGEFRMVESYKVKACPKFVKG